MAIEYSRWRLLGIVSMAATMSIKAFFDGIGKTHVHLVAALVMNVANVLLCWMLIFGHGGAPRMGAPGAGLAAFIATWIGLAIMVVYAALVRSEYHPMRLGNLSRKLTCVDPLALDPRRRGHGRHDDRLRALRAHRRSARRARGRAAGAPIGRCGTAEAVNSAANTDIVETLKLTFTACIAFGTATATLISQSLGRLRPDEAQKWGWASVRLGFVLFGVVGLCEGVLFTEPMVAFLSNSEAVRAAAIFPMRIMGIVTPIIAVALILSEGLFGAGSTKFVAIAQLLLVFGWLVPGAYVLGVVLHLGLNGIWMAAFGYACLAAVVMSTKFAGGSWKKIKL